MAQVISKQNMVISIREYQDNQGKQKKVYKTIGELVTFQGDDGSQYQAFEMWGAGGLVKGNIYEQKERDQQGQQQGQQPQQNKGGFQQQPPQQSGGFQQSQPQGGFAPNNQQNNNNF